MMSKIDLFQTQTIFHLVEPCKSCPNFSGSLEAL